MLLEFEIYMHRNCFIETCFREKITARLKTCKHFSQKKIFFVHNYCCFSLLTTEHVCLEVRTNFRYFNFFVSNRFFLTLCRCRFSHSEPFYLNSSLRKTTSNVFNCWMSGVRALSAFMSRESWFKLAKAILWNQVCLWWSYM